MKQLLILAAITAGIIPYAPALGQTYVTPMMGGGQVAADMVHIDIYYDQAANQLHAMVDTSAGTPMLRPLDASVAFDPLQPYAVLNGKAYNSQYGWNVGGFFSLPPGAAIWMELIHSSACLETYSGWGRLGAYTPIFGTSGSPSFWNWSGVMVHNTYCVLAPPVSRVFADYHIFFGDANTGSRMNFTGFDDTTVRLEWTVVPIDNPLTLKFGANGQTNGAPLCFINADVFTTNSQAILNFRCKTNGPCAFQYEWFGPLMAVPATASNGGPATNAAALGSCLKLQPVYLSGTQQGTLSFWESGQVQPAFSLSAGGPLPAQRVVLSENGGRPGSDPFGCIPGRRLALDQPGLYCFGFRLVDASTNGPEGGPIHAPSPVYHVFLQAGLTIASLSRQGSSTMALFGGEPEKAFYLERSSTLGPDATWETVAGPLSGTNSLQTLTGSPSTESTGFFRLRAL